MKAALCVLLLATALVAADEKNEKRGVLGLGYGGYGGWGGYGGLGLSHAAPLVGGYGHGLGLYSNGLYGHGLGLGLGHGLVGPGLVGPGLVGHGVAAPLLDHGLYGAPVGLGAPLLGLGHGWH